ncbi:MAG: sulfurtransferase [Paludibacter sp.]
MAHLPGALYAHLDQDLSGPITADSGRHPLPDVRTLAATFSHWGIDASKQVIAYDAEQGAMAARLWWLLRWLGHTHVAVLDGGLRQWQAQGFELTSSSFAPAPAQFTAQPDNAWLIDATHLAKYLQEPHWRVLDARAPERYAGAVEPLDSVAGHIPGARNYPYVRNLQTDGRFLPAPQLRTQLEQALEQATPRHTVAMCGSGVTACHNLLAMEIAGLHGARLYAGSWSEWIRDPSRPVATGLSA